MDECQVEKIVGKKVDAAIYGFISFGGFAALCLAFTVVCCFLSFKAGGVSATRKIEQKAEAVSERQKEDEWKQEVERRLRNYGDNERYRSHQEYQLAGRVDKLESLVLPKADEATAEKK